MLWEVRFESTVPAVIDRAIQGAMAKVLNEIYEQDFLKCSFGFRRGLGCHHALATINEVLYRRGMEDVLEVDIRDFFGSLSHEWLMRFLELRIGDGRVRMLIQAWLKAGIFVEGRWQEVERGTPQGGSMTPRTQKITSKSGPRKRACWRHWTAMSFRSKVGHWNGVSDSNRFAANQNLLHNQPKNFLPLNNVQSPGSNTEFATKLR